MSQVLDTKVVEMQFDNSNFEKNIEVSLNSLHNLNKSIDNAGKNRSSFDELASATERVGISFDNMNMKSRISLNLMDMIAGVGTKAFNKISDAVAGFALNMANSLSGMQAMRDGFAEYELKMGSVQTILTGAKIIDPKTGKNLEDDAKRLEIVNQKLEDLNAYSDKTIYSFKDMTSNIGKFTNAGVNLDDAVSAIQGVANVAAVSGANAGEASRAMYNFSQALSSGYIKLIDWKSIENANMATVDFKQQLLDTAVALGTVTKNGNEYITTTTNAQGKISEAFNATKMFNDSLAHQWMTSEVLTQTLKNYSTDVNEMTAAELDAYKAQLKSIGYTDKQIEGIVKLSKKAFAAATEVKTFSQMIDTLKESLGSGWAQTFEIIFGDFNEAKKLWTGLNNVIDGILSPIGEARNEILKIWKTDGGRDAMIQSFKNLYEVIVNIIRPIKNMWDALTPDTTTTGQTLAKVFKTIEKFTGYLVKASNVVSKVLTKVLKPVIYVGKAIEKVIAKAFGLLRSGLGKLTKFLSPMVKAVGKFSDKLSDAFGKHVTANVKKFQGSLSKMFGDIKKHVGESSTVKKLVDAFTAFKKVLEDLFGRALIHAGSAANSFATYIGKLWNAAKPLVSSAVTKTLKSISDFVLPKVRKALGFVTDKLTDLKNLIAKIDIKNSRLYKGLAELPNKIKELTNNKTFKGIATTIKDFGKESVEFLSNKFKSLKTNIEAISMPQGLSDVFENIKNFIKSIFGEDSVNDKINETNQTLSKVSGEEAGEKLTKFQAFLEGVSKAFDWLKEAATRAKDAIKTFIDFIVTNTPKALKAMYNFIAGDDGILTMSDIVDTIDIVSYALSSLMMGSGIKNFSKASLNVTEALNDITGAITDLAKKTSNKLQMSAIKDFAIAVGIVAGAMFLLAQIPDPKKLVVAAGAIIAVGAALTKFFGMLSTGDISTGKFMGNLSIAAILVSIGASMVGIAASVGILVAALAAFPHVIKQYNKLGDDFRSGMDRVKEVLTEIFDYLDHLSSAKFGFRGAAALLGLVMSLNMLQKTIVKYASKKTGKAMADGLDRIREVLTMLSQFLSSISIASLSFINIGVDFDTLGVAAMIWALGDMIVKITDPIERFSKLKPDEYKTAFKVLEQIFFELGAFIVVVSLLSKFTTGASFAQWIGIATTISLLAGAISTIVGSVETIASLASTDPDGLKAALKALRSIFIELGAVFLVIGMVKPKAPGMIFSMTLAVGALTACVIALYPIAKARPEALNTAVLSLGTLMLALGGALMLAGQASHSAKAGDIIKLMAMTLSMVTIGNTLRRLAKGGGDWKNVAAAGAAISGAALAMAGAMKLMNGVHIAPSVLIGLGILTAAIWGVAYAIGAFRSSAGGMIDGAKQVEQGGEAMENALGVQTEHLAAMARDAFPNIFEDAFGEVGETIRNFFANFDLGDSIRNMISTIAEDAKNWAQDFIDIGTNLVDGISTAITDPSNVERIRNSIVDLGKALLDSFKLFFGINSPSTVMAEQGGFILDGLVKGLMEFPSKLAGWIESIGSFILEGITGLFNGALEKGKALANSIGQGIQNGKNAVAKKAIALGQAALEKVGKVKEWGQKAAISVQTYATKIAGGVKSAKQAAIRIASNVGTAIRETVTHMANTATTAATQFASKLRSGIGSAKASAQAIVSGAKSAFSGIWNSFYTFGQNAAEGFKSGINSLIASICAKAREMVRNAKEAAKSEQNSNSPSKDFMEYGGWAAEGYAIGISNRKSLRMVETNARKLVHAAEDATVDSDLNFGSLTLDSNSAISALAFAMSQISDTVDANTEFTPTIRPVLDMSSVARSAMGMSSLFADRSITAGVDIARRVNDDFETRRDNEETMASSIRKLTSRIGAMTDTMNSRSLNNYITVDGASDPSAFADELIRSFKLNARTV